MARMPGVAFRPVPNCTKGGQDAVYGVVLHIMAGTLAGTDSWFRNKAAQASSHFGVGKDGTIYQWVDTADRAWAQADGNRTWLSIEHEGQGGDTLTAKQVAADASIIAWMKKTHGVKLQIADSPTGRGIGWHGMGGSAWGGHTSCPGTPIKNQRAAIIKAAGGNPAPPAPTNDSSGGVARYQVTINGLKYGFGATGSHITKVGQALVKAGCSAYSEGPGPEWTDADTRSYQKYQLKLGFEGTAAHQDADGVPGESTLKKLLGTLPGKAAAPLYEPFPGESFFHTGRTSPIITALGRRLVALGFGGAYKSGPGPSWTNADKANVAAFQRSVPDLAGDADGIPGPKTWAALKIPKLL